MISIRSRGWVLITVMLGFFLSHSVDGFEFSHQGLNGQEYQLSDFKGQWVIINYWATWCAPCRAEIPALVLFYEQHRARGVTVLGVNMEASGVEKIAKFARDYHISYPILLAEPDADTPFGPIMAMPTTFIISPQGKLVKTKMGLVTIDFLKQIIK